MRTYGDGHYDISRRRCKTVKANRARVRRSVAAAVRAEMDELTNDRGLLMPLLAGPGMGVPRWPWYSCDDSCGDLRPLCWGD